MGFSTADAVVTAAKMARAAGAINITFELDEDLCREVNSRLSYRLYGDDMERVDSSSGYHWLQCGGSLDCGINVTLITEKRYDVVGDEVQR